MKREAVPFTISKQDDAGQLIAAMDGQTVWGWLELHRFVVADNWRRRGIGKILMQAVEELAQRRNCHSIEVGTAHYQAPEFYPRFGYKLVAVHKNRPKPFSYYVFTKELGC